MQRRWNLQRDLLVAAGLTLAVAMLVTPVRADEPGAVARMLDRLEDLGVDPMVLPKPPAAPEELDVRERLAIARSIRIVEAELDTSLAVLTGQVLPLLSLARNHHHLGLRGRALQWYDRAEIADKEIEFSEEILGERFTVALELGDSSRVAELAGQMLDRRDASAWTARLTEALAFYATLPGADDDAARLARRIEALDGPIDADCLVELARLRQRRDEDRTAREHYRTLLRRESLLTPRQAALTLMGLADTELAMGHVQPATALLRQYREHDTGYLSAWATYQLAGLAASDARYEEAEHLFRSLCEREADTPWRDHACTRWAQMKELDEIDAALRPFGRSLRPAEGKR
mgnify:CR=1 FL=1